MEYEKQVRLLLQVLPEVAKEECFSLHGGTAINLFLRNLPRLSVDIDLTYNIIEEREATIININTALKNIQKRIDKNLPQLKTEPKPKALKLLVKNHEAAIKIEVNQGMRGLISDQKKLELCERAQEIFNAFCTINLVPIAQLLGGKICAALDRQHPRDLFDTKYILKEYNSMNELKNGIIYCFLSSNRPIHELLNPNLIDQKSTFETEFKGMTKEKFTYADFEETRFQLINNLITSLEESDKQFLLSFCDTNPQWKIYNFRNYPSVKWKLQNLKILKDKNAKKHSTQTEALRAILYSV